MVKIYDGMTLYKIQILCLNCWRNNPKDVKKCCYCGHIFQREASDKESEDLVERLNEQRDNKKEV